jgi:hypothetical protein
MKARIWKDGIWYWRVRKPGLVQSGPAPSWSAALAAVLTVMGHAGPG